MIRDNGSLMCQLYWICNANSDHSWGIFLVHSGYEYLPYENHSIITVKYR